MAIENFQELLSKALHGEYSSLLLWHQYTKEQRFSVDEITDALTSVNQIISQAEHAQIKHALFLRAFMHQKGQGGPVNYVEAIRLYEQAIELNNASAMHKRAFMHERGIGGEVNHLEAIRLYEKAIDLGYASSMTNRAVMHEEGRGGPINYVAAICLYERAISLGDVSAMNNRALMHIQGLGGSPNHEAAIDLYTQAISLDDADARNNLSNLLMAIMPTPPVRGPSFYPRFFKRLVSENCLTQVTRLDTWRE